MAIVRKGRGKTCSSLSLSLHFEEGELVSSEAIDKDKDEEEEDKKKEVTCLLAQVSDAADKISQRQLFEAKLLCAIEDAQIKCFTEESDLKCNIMREIYETFNFNIEDSDIESIMQGLCGIIFENGVSLELEALEKEAAIRSRSPEMELVDKEGLRQEIRSLEELIEEKEKLAEETTVALANEKEQSELACQELDNLQDQMFKALEQIEIYKVEKCESNQKLELIMKQSTEVDEERRIIHALAQEKQNAKLLIALAQGLSNAVAGFECRVTENISNISLRLENLNSESRLLIPNANVLRGTGMSYKQKLERKCSDLEKAEAEVDLLGDQVDALLSLLEKLYIALDHYSPILQPYPGIIEILKLVNRELRGESTRPV